MTAVDVVKGEVLSVRALPRPSKRSLQALGLVVHGEEREVEALAGRSDVGPL